MWRPSIISNGKVIKAYLDDKPFPSYLIFDYIENRPIHVVTAFDAKTVKAIVITAYEPSSIIWKEDFKSRR